MVRTVNLERPVELLNAVCHYMVTHSVAEVSLRQLAKAVGSSPRGLLNYFSSKDELVVTALAHLRERQRAAHMSMKAVSNPTPADAQQTHVAPLGTT